MVKCIFFVRDWDYLNIFICLFVSSWFDHHTYHKLVSPLFYVFTYWCLSVGIRMF